MCDMVTQKVIFKIIVMITKREVKKPNSLLHAITKYYD